MAGEICEERRIPQEIFFHNLVCFSYWTCRKEGAWCIYEVIFVKHQEREELGGVSPDDQSKVRMNVLETRGRIQKEQPTTAVPFCRVSLKLPPLKKVTLL